MLAGFNSFLRYEKVRTAFTVLTSSTLAWLPLVDVLRNDLIKTEYAFDHLTHPWF